MSTPQALTSQLADALINEDQDAVIAILAQVIAYITDIDSEEDINEDITEDTTSPPLAKAHKDAGDASFVVPRLLPYLLLKAYPHEHAARQANPASFDTIRRKELAPGVTALIGFNTGSTSSKVESIRFDSAKFTEEEARKWLTDHNFSDAKFEPASVEKMGPTVDAVHIDTIESKLATTCDICGKSPCECTDGNFIITKAGEERRLAYGIVYAPGSPRSLDSQGDWATADEVEAMAHRFLVKSRSYDLQHLIDLPDDKVELVESYVAPCDFMLGSKLVKAGSWIAVTHFLDESLWSMVRAGQIKAYSIRGYGTRIPDTTLNPSL